MKFLLSRVVKKEWVIIILLKLKMNSSFLTKIKEWNLKNLNWFFTVRALKRFMTDRNNKMMRDLSKIFKISIENLNTKTLTKIINKAFIKSIKALRVFMIEISDFAESLNTFIKTHKKFIWHRIKSFFIEIFNHFFSQSFFLIMKNSKQMSTWAFRNLNSHKLFKF